MWILIAPSNQLQIVPVHPRSPLVTPSALAQITSLNNMRHRNTVVQRYIEWLIDGKIEYLPSHSFYRDSIYTYSQLYLCIEYNYTTNLQIKSWTLI